MSSIEATSRPKKSAGAWRADLGESIFCERFCFTLMGRPTKGNDLHAGNWVLAGSAESNALHFARVYRLRQREKQSVVFSVRWLAFEGPVPLSRRGVAKFETGSRRSLKGTLFAEALPEP